VNITRNRSVIVFSFLFLISSCTAVSNTSNQSQQKLEGQVVKIDGSSYGGENQINLTLGQLLRKEAKF
jgi:hypothetical protein